MGCVTSQDGDWAKDDEAITREEDRVEGKLKYKIGDIRFIEMEKWPLVLLDTTGSMQSQCEQNDRKSRQDLVYETVWQIIQMLVPYDSVDNENNDKQLLLGKGIPLITFNAIEGGTYRGLLHSNNYVNEWNNIKFHGGTHIMDGWRKMLQTYETHFSDRPQDQWPLLLALVITDGELQDGKEFEEHLKNVKGRIFVEIAVVGYGEDHDRAIKHYMKIAKKHDHVRVTAFTDHLDPAVLCKRLISLIDPKCIQQITSEKLMAPNQQMFNNNNNNNINNNIDNNNNNSAIMYNNNGLYNNATVPTAPLNPNY